MIALYVIGKFDCNFGEVKFCFQLPSQTVQEYVMVINSVSKFQCQGPTDPHGQLLMFNESTI
jgi:hypothetical protein